MPIYCSKNISFTSSLIKRVKYCKPLNINNKVIFLFGNNINLSILCVFRKLSAFDVTLDQASFGLDANILSGAFFWLVNDHLSLDKIHF